ncbi:MAG: O-methyltransferase [Sphingomonadaceae bacterium]|nr:O-methyltransferase [Sphingomonadaceae bacterium]
MATEREAAVDDYIVERLIGEDEAVAAALAANVAAGLPPIEVSIAQGRMLQLYARMIGARRILEVGTLGGVSTIFLARALPEGGRLISCEINPKHAEVARGNVANAGLADKVDIRVGPAIDTLGAMLTTQEAAFDLVFIDADKQSNPDYVRAALHLAHPGTIIIVDNVIRQGGVIEEASSDPMILGTRALFDLVHAEKKLTATAIQTVGAKHWDGFLIAIVEG